MTIPKNLLENTRHRALHEASETFEAAGGLPSGTDGQFLQLQSGLWAPHTLVHADLGGVSANQHHPEVHDIDGADHDGFPGGTTTFLRADGAFATPAGTATPLTVKELDGTPSGTPSTLEFPNGTLTDHGGGVYEYVPASVAAGATLAYKTADESVTSSTTLQDDDHLFFSIGASETWIVRFVLFADGSTTGNIKIALTAPTGATAQIGVLGPSLGETHFNGALVHNEADLGLGTGVGIGTLGAGNFVLVHFEAAVFNSTTAGSVKLQFAQNTSDGTASKLKKGSFLTAWKVA